jgi:hypothetical protein
VSGSTAAGTLRTATSARTISSSTTGASSPFAVLAGILLGGIYAGPCHTPTLSASSFQISPCPFVVLQVLDERTRRFNRHFDRIMEYSSRSASRELGVNCLGQTMVQTEGLAPVKLTPDKAFLARLVEEGPIRRSTVWCAGGLAT